ncbi:MAG: UvrD-helicase domain-containing protein [Candidatus Nanopelagicaceae bacterium]
MTKPISALDIAKVTKKVPTEEQIKIIESALQPAVVIAGAGSGKTETMATRVLWLVANGYAKPEEILGLTFTRKAAAELKKRIKERLKQLRKEGLIDKSLSIEVPVMTYHSYAGNILREYGLRLGIDTDSDLIGEAVVWQQAAKVLRNWDDEVFEYEGAFKTLVKDLLGLTKSAMEHGITEIQIIEESNKILDKLAEISSDKDIDKVRLVLKQRIKLLEISKKLREERIASGQLSFDDQMSYAAQIAQEVEKVGELERAKYRVVLLDEYQDTSQSQVRMLSALFKDGHPVMAVGDPYQAIYGWRGAAIGTIKNFAKVFAGKGNAQKIAEYKLSTTFRNDIAILNLANEVGKVVGQQIELNVKELQPRDGAGTGQVLRDIYENVELEAAGIAERLAKLWEQKGSDETFAVLVRNRKQIPEIEKALRAQDLPVEVLGIGGLMQVPEVTDVFTLLKAIVDVEAGSALMRHLTSPRLAIGVQDLAALGRFKRKRESNSGADKDLITAMATQVLETAEADDNATGSLIEALDEIESADRSEFSDVGFKRLVEFSKDLRRLRNRANGSLIDLIYEIEEYLSLRVELLVRNGGSNGRRHLDRFNEEAAKFSVSNGSIVDFVRWLDATIDHERGLESGAPEVHADVIQLLTIHMSKGAEWDHVVIPGIVEKQFPKAYPQNTISWLHNEAEIPFDLRGDAAEFPPVDISQLSSAKAAATEFKEFKDACAAFRREEEWRLAYVAVTRAKHTLHCTMSYWDTRTNIDEASDVFKLICQFLKVESDLDGASKPATNPLLEREISENWPLPNRLLEKLSIANEIFESVAPAVNDEDAALLIKQIEDRRISTDIYLPPRVSVSTLIALKENPELLAQSIRRPMPFLQDQFARRGTDFHNWVEQHLKASTLFDDDDLDYFDRIEEDHKLEELKNKWLASDWAKKDPYRLEVPFETVLAGVLIRGRIDAVYKTETGYEVVDWKTGSKKLSAAAAIQLAMYRLAWAKIAGVPVEQVSAAFHYVPSGEDDRRSDLLTEAQLVELLERH